MEKQNAIEVLVRVKARIASHIAERPWTNYYGKTLNHRCIFLCLDEVAAETNLKVQDALHFLQLALPYRARSLTRYNDAARTSQACMLRLIKRAITQAKALS